MDYDFAILDNAFLLHNGKHTKSGVWAKWRQSREYKIEKEFHTHLARDAMKIYGNIKGCVCKNSDFDD